MTVEEMNAVIYQMETALGQKGLPALEKGNTWNEVQLINCTPFSLLIYPEQALYGAAQGPVLEVPALDEVPEVGEPQDGIMYVTYASERLLHLNRTDVIIPGVAVLNMPKGIGYIQTI